MHVFHKISRQIYHKSLSTLTRRRESPQLPFYRVHESPQLPFYRISRVFPHEVAESEEKEVAPPEWGEISSTGPPFR